MKKKGESESFANEDERATFLSFQEGPADCKNQVIQLLGKSDSFT